MEMSTLKTVGQIAGIGGICVGIFLLVIQSVLKKRSYTRLNGKNSYSLLRLIIILTWIIALAGLALYGWIWQKNGPGSPSGQPACTAYTIVGSLVEVTATGTALLNNAQVSLQNKSPYATDEFITNGSFTIHHVPVKLSDPYIDLWIYRSGKALYHKRIKIASLPTESVSCEVNLGTIRLGKENSLPKAATGNKTPDSKTFCLNITNRSLIQTIQQKTAYSYRRQSPVFVELTYSGAITQLNQGLYYYPGGALLVKVAAFHCEQATSLPLKRTLPAGNELSFIQHTLREQIEQLVKDSCTTIAQTIASCLL
jgi:hypothetical protein